MKKRHICFVVYSRANYARIKTAILACQRDPEVTTSVIVGASAVLYKYGNVAQMMRSDGVNISTELYNAVEGDLPVSMAKTTGLGILDLSQEFFRIKPDVVVTVADRFETLGTAIAASYMNITLAHTQGGEITGSIDESVRHACSKLAHIHFPATAEAKEVLLQMGEDENTILIALALVSRNGKIRRLSSSSPQPKSPHAPVP
jgi:UDP-hydrolysing UDP-N-acetyl-D-glucosamine 2-epimerase